MNRSSGRTSTSSALTERLQRAGSNKTDETAPRPCNFVFAGRVNGDKLLAGNIGSGLSCAKDATGGNGHNG